MKYIVTRYFDYIAENIKVFDNKEEAKKYFEEAEQTWKDSLYTHFEFKEVPDNARILESKLVVKNKSGGLK